MNNYACKSCGLFLVFNHLRKNNDKEDGLCDWDVMVVDGEICYINKLLRTYSYDYPKSTTPELSPETLPTPIPENYNHIRCTFTEIYNTIKSYF